MTMALLQHSGKCLKADGAFAERNTTTADVTILDMNFGNRTEQPSTVFNNILTERSCIADIETESGVRR